MNNSQEQELVFQETIRIKLDYPGSVFGTFFKGALRAARRSQGAVCTDVIKKIIVEMNGIAPDSRQIRRYCAVCGFLPDGQFLPVTFPEILFLHPLGAMITSPEFPLSPMGLIHLNQRITQPQPLPVDAEFDLTCEMEKMVQTPRGILLDIRLAASIYGACVWEGAAGFISRNKKTIKGGALDKTKGDASKKTKPQREFKVPADTGRRYATASGDYNPHHLYPVTAKILGYKKPIAHGMWSLARSLSCIEQEIGLSYPCAIHASFKRPIFMPATVSLLYEELPEGNAIEFKMYDSIKGFPHVIGKIS